MSLGLIITMGSVSVGGALIEKLLGKLGKSDEAQMVGIASTTMLGATVVGCVLKLIGDVRKLGN
jgi:hypothetical protein